MATKTSGRRFTFTGASHDGAASEDRLSARGHAEPLVPPPGASSRSTCGCWTCRYRRSMGRPPTKASPAGAAILSLRRTFLPSTPCDVRVQYASGASGCERSSRVGSAAPQGLRFLTSSAAVGPGRDLPARASPKPRRLHFLASFARLQALRIARLFQLACRIPTDLRRNVGMFLLRPALRKLTSGKDSPEFPAQRKVSK